MSRKGTRRGLLDRVWLFAAAVAVLASGGARADGPTFEHSYAMTTREAPGAGDANLNVLTDGRMFFCSAPGHYVQTAADYTTAAGTACDGQPDQSESSATPPEPWLLDLESDLARTVGADRTARLVLYIHGLNVLFADAVQEGAQLGLHLQGANTDNAGTGTRTCDQSPLPRDCILCPQNARQASFPGLVVTFDWPNFAVETGIFEELDLLVLAAPVIAKETRQRADDSAPALVNAFA